MKQRTVNTKAYQAMDEQHVHDAVSLRVVFMVAVRHLVNQNWSLWQGFEQPHPHDQSKVAYELLPVEEGLSLTDAFTKLAQFEMDKDNKGLLASANFSYPNAAYFRDVLPHYGLVTDLNSGRIIELQGSAMVPQEGALIDPEALMQVADIQSQTARSATSPLELLVPDQALVEVDYDLFFNAQNILNAFAEMRTGFHAAGQYLRRIKYDGRLKSEGRRWRSDVPTVNSQFDVIKSFLDENHHNNYKKGFWAALGHAESAYKKIKAKLPSETRGFMDEIISGYKLSYDVIKIAIEADDQAKGGSAIEGTLMKEKIERLSKKYGFSEDQNTALPYYLIDGDHYDILRFVEALYNSFQQIQSKTQNVSQSLQKQAKGQVMRPVMGG